MALIDPHKTFMRNPGVQASIVNRWIRGESLTSLADTFGFHPMANGPDKIRKIILEFVREFELSGVPLYASPEMVREMAGKAVRRWADETPGIPGGTI